jgi:hypothetical protein
MATNGKSKALALFSVIAVAAIISSVLLVPQMVNATAADDTSLTTSDSTETTPETNTPILPDNPGCMDFGRHPPEMRGFGGFGPVEVSEEFEQTVTNIAENDTDVQDLINDSYNVTSVHPIIKTVIDAEGNVVTKATNAILTLQKDTTGHATVMVDIDEAKVTQITILTRTVIDKS